VKTPPEVLNSAPASRERILWDLLRYGYFEPVPASGEVTKPQWDAVKNKSLNTLLAQDAVARYQGFSGTLVVDGEAKEVTQQYMSIPRCGCPDLVQEAGSRSEWPSACRTVTTSHRLNDLRVTFERSQIHAIWLEMLRNWNSACGINLVFQQSMNAMIYANAGKTDQGVLAWSFLPQSCRSRLEQMYGSQHTWTPNKLLEVETHEVGHALGLSHGPRGSIMHATALGEHTTPQGWDIEQVQLRYGKNTDPDPPTVPTPEDGWVVLSESVWGDGRKYQVRRLESSTGGGGGDWGA
jgi:hypothetical protein